MNRTVVFMRRTAICGALALMLAAPGRTAAQTSGRIAGQVIGETQPLSAVQVHVVGTSLGALTGADGRFVIDDVPAGEHRVRAQRLGYAAATVVVLVEPGAVATAGFTMSQQPLALDAVVVTGTAGQARRREVGNTIAQIDVNSRKEPASTVENILQAASPGLSVMETDGQAGSGKSIRLRGNISAAMSNQPLIYVDGVRLRSDGMPVGGRAGGDGFSSSRTVASPLSSINPADIERIEVIKGAAATTLYGTEAAAGVIQIFTRRGRDGAPVWRAEITQGVDELVADIGPEASPMLGMEPFLQRGHRQRYAVSASGGSEMLRYFLSGSLDDNTGIVRTNSEARSTLRANLTASVMPELQIDWNTSLALSDIQNYSSGNNTNGLETNVFRAPANYVGSTDPVRIDSLLALTHGQEINHAVTGVTARYTPFSNFDSRITFGIDQLGNELITRMPFGFITERTGHRTVHEFNQRNLTVDFVNNLRSSLGPLDATFSLGGQWVENEERNTYAWADGFPGPGEATVASGAIRRSDETRLRTITAGAFGQTLFGLADRYFLTLGLRVDGNSAFGEALGLQSYPKASFAWVVSDEPFWNDALGTLKLRAAYGHSGRAPGAFDAVRTWTAVGWGDQSAFLPGAVGNENLGPERTKETEGGFDLSLAEDRVTAEFTAYFQTTTDALVAVQRAPSAGFLSRQLENVGTFKNRGLELGINASLLQTDRFGWDVGVNLATNRNEVVDLGSAPQFSVGADGWIIEGQPLPVMVGDYIANRDAYAAPVLERGHIFGPNQPTRIYGLTSTVTLPGGITLSGLAEYMGGHFIKDRASRNMATRQVWAPCKGAEGGYALIAAGRLDELQAWERQWCVPSGVGSNSMIVPADFAKIRHLTLQVPIGFAVPGSSNANFTASLRNLPLWKHPDMLVLDPEMAGDQGLNNVVREITEKLPAPQRLQLSIDMLF